MNDHRFCHRLPHWPLITAFASAIIPNVVSAQELSVQYIGNAGVILSDSTTSLLIDLPYESGAFGYMQYDPELLQPSGGTVSVITHDHADHFDPSLFMAHGSWRIIGPPSITETIPPDRVLSGDSVTVGAFLISAISTPHSADHRSYRIRWRSRVFHFAGDTDSAASIPIEPHLDILFVTPWLQCALQQAGRERSWDRAVLYHHQPDASDEICGDATRLEQGARLTLSAQ